MLVSVRCQWTATRPDWSLPSPPDRFPAFLMTQQVARAAFVHSGEDGSMKQEASLRTLPMEGLALRELVMQGNGKDAEVRVVSADGRRFCFEIGGSLRIAVRGTVLTEVQSLDDVSLRVRYTAEHLVLKRAQIHFPGSEAEWEEDVAKLGSNAPLSWVIPYTDLELVGA